MNRTCQVACGGPAEFVVLPARAPHLERFWGFFACRRCVLHYLLHGGTIRVLPDTASNAAQISPFARVASPTILTRPELP